MLLIALTQEANYSDVEDANDEGIRDYKKKARRTAKQLKGKSGSASVAQPASVTPKKKDGCQDSLEHQLI